MENGYCVVYVTAPGEKEAMEIAGHCVSEKLAACANLLNPVRSLYWWDGKVQDDQEVLIMMKTRLELFDKLQAAVTEKHPYDVPEIIAIPIAGGNKPYLDWIDENTGSK